MTASRTPAERPSMVSPVIDYEPAPVGIAACRSTPALRKRSTRPLRPAPPPAAGEAAPPRSAIHFADAALRRVLEVIDRRRPLAQLQSMLAPPVVDTVTAAARTPHTRAATLRRVRLRMVDSGDGNVSAEVFGSYTRGARVRALAARIVHTGDRWRIVALTVG